MHDTAAQHLPDPSRRTLHVAVVTETYPPEVNGVALTAARFVNALRAEGHEVEVVRPRQRADAAQARAASTPSGTLDVLTRGITLPRYPGLQMGLPAAAELKRRWRSRSPDVVHIVTEGPLGWSALRAAEALALPVVSDFRTDFHAYCEHYGLDWLATPVLAYLRNFHNRTHATLVPTEALRHALAAKGFRNVDVVARGVDTCMFHPARRSDALRESWGAGPSDPVFLYVGRLAPEKNPKTLVAAYVAARSANPGAKLVIVGDGPARAEFTSACPDAILTGTRRDENLATHYASADAFLFPSKTETFGNVTIEAMASGLAVIAYDHAAAHELITSGHNGVAVAFDDDTGFVDTACRLARDVDLAHTLGAAARSTALTRDWRTVAGRLEAILTAAAQGTPAAAAQDAGRWPAQQAG